MSRVPYSKHQYSGLKVVPFQIDDSYDTIMDKVISAKIESFNKDRYITNFNLKLLNIEKKLKHYNSVFQEKKQTSISLITIKVIIDVTIRMKTLETS